jgi:hypothetical protein
MYVVSEMWVVPRLISVARILPRLQHTSYYNRSVAQRPPCRNLARIWLLPTRTVRNLSTSSCRSLWLTESSPMSVRAMLASAFFLNELTSISVPIVQHMRNPRTRLAKVTTSYADEEHIKHVLLLSGTPNPTSMLDLWTPLRLINVRHDILL